MNYNGAELVGKRIHWLGNKRYAPQSGRVAWLGVGTFGRNWLEITLDDGQEMSVPIDHVSEDANGELHIKKSND